VLFDLRFVLHYLYHQQHQGQIYLRLYLQPHLKPPLLHHDTQDVYRLLFYLRAVDIVVR
jgi:hypothetical protein